MFALNGGKSPAGKDVVLLPPVVALLPLFLH